MTPDDVLAQIDHAVDDWAVSEDAMRWLPDQATHEGEPLRSGGTLWRQLVRSSLDRDGAPAAYVVHDETAEFYQRADQTDPWPDDDGEAWRAANPTMPSIVQHPSPRAYVTTSAEAWRAHPMDLSQWTELGHTEDGAGLRFHLQPPRPVDLPGPTLQEFARLRTIAARVGIELTDWQARILVALGPAFGPQRPEPDPLEDPDRPGLPLRIVGGRDAQRSPYGPQRRGRW